MKKLRFLALAAALVCASAVISKAQESTDSCLLYISYYQDYYKQGSTQARMEAMRSWRKAYSICKPGVRQNLYIHGGALYRMLIAKNAKDEKYVAALVDTLLAIDHTRIDYYASNPKFSKSCYDNLSADITNYILKKDPVRAYKELSDVISVLGANATPLTFASQLNAAIALFKDGKMETEEVINCYTNIENAFTQIHQTDTTAKTREIHAGIQTMFANSKIASCDNLVAIFTPRFNDMKGDIAQVGKLVKLLASADDCTGTDLYLQAVMAMHALQPSASSAYYLARLYATKGDFKEAVAYMNEACSTETDKTELARDCYELSVYQLSAGNYGKAAAAAASAVENDASYAGRAYMIIGQAWMSSSCQANEMDSKAKFWVAADYFSKARNADESVAENASKMLSQCSSYYPSTSDAFMYDLQNGQSYTISCNGMYATTTVRTK